jgi:hypothetical protein
MQTKIALPFAIISIIIEFISLLTLAAIVHFYQSAKYKAKIYAQLSLQGVQELIQREMRMLMLQVGGLGSWCHCSK